MKMLNPFFNYYLPKSSLLMSIFFSSEVFCFGMWGVNLAMKLYLESSILFICGLFFAFTLGDAIRIREREGYKG